MSTADRTAWIVNHHATNAERDGRSGRHEQLARRLGASGWRAVVVAASTDHPSGRQTFGPGRLRARWQGPAHEFVWLRGVGYDRLRVLRALDVLVFTALVLLPGALRGLPAPDLVVGSSVHPLAAWAGARLARRHGVPFVYEPRDLWPETLVQFGVLSRRHPVTRLLESLQRRAVEQAALVVSPLEGAGRYLADRGLHAPFLWVPNGVSADRDAPGTTREHARPGTDSDSDSDSDSDTFEIAYLGSMGPANALGAVVEAFDRASRSPGGERLVLRLVGTGSQRAELIARAALCLHADRVVFEGHVSQGRARQLGRAADCLVANLQPLDLYRHGTSLNKFFEYLLLGKPVVLGASVDLDPVTDAGAGVRVPGDDVEALAGAMLAVAALTSDERTAMGERGRRHVLEHYDYDVLAARFAAGLDDAVTSASGRSAPGRAAPSDGRRP